ncbi:hypothetical protein [Nocardia puris]|uniref:Uncharacterized protein n=1 Tax=Nocardia puris TaxID=208602 RepID=A0A366DAF3_9NOCA|nr:hypothetical protein [Nocardia puris]RBO87027.1 hypothetical protein DFR74_112204 [Nocardia puris]
MQHDIPVPNPAVTALLMSREMRALMWERGEIAQALYREIVSKRTARLARSARPETFVGGDRNDRWCVRLLVGGPGAYYGLPHEFGYEIEHEDETVTVVEGAHDLNLVLNAMGTLL